jgi:predicted Zn-dependent protease
LQRLKKAHEAQPDDPALLFLYGYQLFFLGDRKEAAKLFKRASVRTKENAIIERFLVETQS